MKSTNADRRRAVALINTMPGVSASLSKRWAVIRVWTSWSSMLERSYKTTDAPKAIERASRLSKVFLALGSKPHSEARAMLKRPGRPQHAKGEALLGVPAGSRTHSASFGIAHRSDGNDHTPAAPNPDRIES